MIYSQNIKTLNVCYLSKLKDKRWLKMFSSCIWKYKQILKLILLLIPELSLVKGSLINTDFLFMRPEHTQFIITCGEAAEIKAFALSVSSGFAVETRLSALFPIFPPASFS